MRARVGAWRVSLTLFRSMLVLATERVLLCPVGKFVDVCSMLILVHLKGLYLSCYTGMFECLKAVMCLISTRLRSVDW